MMDLSRIRTGWFWFGRAFDAWATIMTTDIQDSYGIELSKDYMYSKMSLYQTQGFPDLKTKS